ncbi:MAG: site-2 protease family protein [Christensenellaceae bacterium]|nr:site-2 protease family protein [Christensenellaceae bacterium]
MDTVFTILCGLLLLTALVTSHEFGHFIVGKACGIKINEFSIGFGPKLLSRVSKKDGIRYSVRLLPLGGYVAFLGEDDADDDPNAFCNVSVLKRALTTFAGPFFNILVTVLISIGVLAFYGDYTPVIQEATIGMPAYEAGIEAGDRIVGVDGQKIDFITEFSLAFMRNENESVALSVERNGEILDFDIPFAIDENGDKKIGILYMQERHRFGFFESVPLSFKWMGILTEEMYTTLGDLFFRGEGIENFAGPVGSATIIGAAVRSSFETVLRLLTMLSLNLAVMNLLPFPALDGGRLVLLLIEKIRGKALPKEKEAIINLVGLVVLFGFMIFLTYKDIVRLF